MEPWEVHDFCREWCLNLGDRETLKKEFNFLKWDFSEFREIAQKQGWWMVSMLDLESRSSTSCDTLNIEDCFLYTE